MSDVIVAITSTNHNYLLDNCIKSLASNIDYAVIDTNDFDSLAACWNHAIREYGNDYRGIVLSNDDVEFIDNTPRVLYKTLSEFGPKYNVLMTCAYDVNKHGNMGYKWIPISEMMEPGFCFCVTKELVDKVGWFDENFKRTWFDDTDMYYRILLNGYMVATVAPAIHIGQGTTKTNPKLAAEKDAIYESNKQYYIEKHGGLPGHERVIPDGWTIRSL